jgi:3-hydroxyisobutyrate dehydrogenase-like beta-hydroxyacid dehydrogenase
MKPQLAVIAPGQMGAAVAARLVANGAEVVTCLEGRSDASRARASAAGMRDVPPDRLLQADMLLSILPPGDALALAEGLAPRMAELRAYPLYVDCNAVNPETAKAIAETVMRAGGRFVDAGIIGGPPRPGSKGPTFYASGEAARQFAALASHGLTIKVIDGPVGAASALKMSYAGITKGLSGLSAAMLLGARRAGVGEALMAELDDSQPELAARFAKGLPDMYPKAYRWVAEMEEIAGFLAEDEAASAMFHGLAGLFARIAEDFAEDRRETGALDALMALRGAKAA